jgi:ATP phosphoribosyltransferase regulatory subunit
LTDPAEAELTEAPALPDGARDVLPIEAAELAAIESALDGTLSGFGYRPVRTPVLEYAEVMDRAQEGGVGRAFRLFDEHGEVLLVRPDLTVPVARLVASRLADHPGPLRVSYVAERVVPPRPGKAQAIEERQVGFELVGLAGPAADAEVVAALVNALTGLGLDDLKVALGDVSLMRAVLLGLGVSEENQVRLQSAVHARNLVAWRRIAESLPLDVDVRRAVIELPSIRGGAEVLRELCDTVPTAGPQCTALLTTLDLLATHGVDAYVMTDLGVLRDWGYYSGIVVEAYAPGVGKPVAVGGRYDGLIGRFGAPRPAVGAAIILDRVHEALAARNGRGETIEGVVVAGGIERELGVARALRESGEIVIGVSDAPEVAERLAKVEGWRYVARRNGTGFTVTDRLQQRSVECSEVGEGLRSLRS